MRHRKFGSLSWEVSEIGLGTYAIGGNWGPTDDAESLRVIKRAFDLGVNFFDTSDVYGLGKSENLLSQAFSDSGLRSQIYIASKGGRDFTSNPPKIARNFDVSYLDEALNASLKRLKTDYIDLYQLHGPSLDVMKQGDVFLFLEKAKQEGKIRAAGVSLYTYDEVHEALQHAVVDSVQYIFNMLAREAAEDVFSLCKQKGIAIMVREPLAQGLLTGNYAVDSTFPADDHRSRGWTREFLEAQLARVEKLKNLTNPDRTLVQTALQFILNYKEVSIVIPGSRTLDQINENIATQETPSLSQGELRSILEI